MIYKKEDFDEYERFIKASNVSEYIGKYKPCLFVLDLDSDAKLIEELIKNHGAKGLVREKGAILLTTESLSALPI